MPILLDAIVRLLLSAKDGLDDGLRPGNPGPQHVVQVSWSGGAAAKVVRAPLRQVGLQQAEALTHHVQHPHGQIRVGPRALQLVGGLRHLEKELQVRIQRAEAA